jgi:hypothetical protein
LAYSPERRPCYRWKRVHGGGRRRQDDVQGEGRRTWRVSRALAWMKPCVRRAVTSLPALREGAVCVIGFVESVSPHLHHFNTRLPLYPQFTFRPGMSCSTIGDKQQFLHGNSCDVVSCDIHDTTETCLNSMAEFPGHPSVCCKPLYNKHVAVHVQVDIRKYLFL